METSSVKEHYENHLARFYSWMCGDFEEKAREQQALFQRLNVLPVQNALAIDLGAGHGLQTVALAKLGFTVTAVDFNKELLDELRKNAAGLNVQTVEDEIENIGRFKNKPVELIVCAGDTIAHLPSEQAIQTFVKNCCEALLPGGKLFLSFRNYSVELQGNDRFIPVKNDNDRILTCYLEYDTDYVKVTDILHERQEQGWQQKISSYQKVRVTLKMVEELLSQHKMEIIFNEVVGRMNTIIAVKTHI